MRRVDLLVSPATGLVVALAPLALVACPASIATATQCTWDADCPDEAACSAGVCQLMPETRIVSGPASAVASSSATFVFESPQNEMSFECRLDTEMAYSPCVSPVAFGGIPDGTWTLEVRSKDSGGVVDGTPATWTWTVDTTAADTSLTSGIDLQAASSTATFVFTSPDPSVTFECRLDTDAAFAPCISPLSYLELPDGVRTFQVRAVDPLGNVDLSPAAQTWTIATTGQDPAEPVGPATTTPETVLTSSPGAIQSEAATFEFSSTEVGVRFECALDSSESFEPCTSPKSLAGLSIGSHTFRVRAIDALGNADPVPATHAWTQAPETTVTWSPLEATNRTTERVAFSSPTSGATFQCQLDSGTPFSCRSPHTFPGLTEGFHTVSVRAVVGTVIDPSPATVGFTVSSSAPLLHYAFEGNGANEGLVAGQAATLTGGAAYDCTRSHGGTGSCSLRFNAVDGDPPTGRSSATLPGVRSVLSHDYDGSDARYTIAFWYWEDPPVNVLVSADSFFPTIVDTRNGAAGFEVYHGVSTSQPPPWYTCWSGTLGTSGTSGCTNGDNAAAGVWHRMVIEYGYSASSSGWDLMVYIDGAQILSESSGILANVFTPTQMDPVLGADTKGNLDDFKVFNRTFGGNPP